MPPKHQRPKVIGESSRVPKKPRTRRDPPEPPVEESPPFSSTKFTSPMAEQNFRMGYARRAVLCERGILIEMFEEQPYNLLSLITARGWQSWVKFQHKVFVPLVKEFYANVVASRDDTGSRCITSSVRRIQIELRPSDISELFQIPREGSQRLESEAEVDLRKENLAKLLTDKEDAVWLGPTLSKKLLSQRCNILHRLLCSHLMPHAFTSSVSLKQATFMGKILLGVHIDLAKHIFDIIDGVAKNPCGTGGLPFGGLISFYLLRNGVKGKAKHEVIHPMDRISPTLTRRSSGQLKRKDTQVQEEEEQIHQTGSQPEEQIQEEGPSQDPPCQEPAEEYSLKGLYEMVRSMQQRQENMFEELKERQRAIYSGFMKMYDHYRELDEKVDRLLKENGEESSSSQEDTPPRDKREDSVETCIQKTIAMAREEDALRAHPPIQQHSSMPTSSEPIASPTAAADPTRKTATEGPTGEHSSSEDHPQGNK